MDNVFDKMFYDEGKFIGGLDESGVIDMAGPLMAACVILPKIDISRDDLRIFEVNDSKQTPERFRKHYAEIVWQVATAIGIGEVTPQEIDYFGTPAAVKIAMTRAVVACKTTIDGYPLIPDFLLLDGSLSNNQLDLPIRQKTVGKGDTKSLSIASASIVAKVCRDEAMLKLAEQEHWYDWASNKGHHCENQFLGLDSYGIRLGVHRLKSWPFISDETAVRRKQWKQITVDRVFQQLKTQLEDLKKLSQQL
jgi:ribonuclease HII